MQQINCAIATPKIREMASKLGRDVVVVTNAVATWQSQNNTSDEPTLEQVKALFEQAKKENLDFFLAVPNATVRAFSKNVKPIMHIGNQILLTELPSVSPMEYFYNLFKNIPELKNLVSNPQEAYWFMLWKEQALITNGWGDDKAYEAEREALKRIREYKRRNPVKALTNNYKESVKALRDLFKWSREHITKDSNFKENHIYYVDGVPANFSVSQFYEAAYGSKNIIGDYSYATAIGNTMDAIYRDFFEGKDITKIQYPNMNAVRIQQVLQDLNRFREYLNNRFGKDSQGNPLYKVITTEFPIAAKVGDKTIVGTMDMVVIDNEGYLHIFDMKAKSHSIDQKYNGVVNDDRRDYTAQQNLYKAILESNPALKGKVKSLQLIWMDTNLTDMRHQGASYTTDNDGNITVKDRTTMGQPLYMSPMWKTPSLKFQIQDSIIPLATQKKVANLEIPSMNNIQEAQKKNNDGKSASEQIPAYYEGLITPDDNTIFVFGSNPEGRHGTGAAKVAKDKFGAIYGQGEGLQGNAYALPTKDLRVKENNSLKSISPEQITENIRRMYDVARQNPDKQFKIAYTNGLNEATLNGYTGAEMIKMFKDAGPIPSNVVFSKNWTDHWNESQTTQQSQQPKQTLNISFSMPSQLASEAPSTPSTEYNPYNRPDMTVERVGLRVNMENPQAKLARDFTPNERTLRVETIARDLTRAIDAAQETLVDEINEQINEARKERDSEKQLRLVERLLRVQDPDNGRRNTIEEYTPNRLFKDIRDNYEEISNMTPGEADEIYGEGNGTHAIDVAQRVLDNFYPLLDEATSLIERWEDFRIVLEDTTVSNGNSTNTEKSAVVVDSSEKQEREEAEYGDDEEGDRVNGSDGWSFQTRFVDPHSTVSKRVKRILADIALQGPNGLEYDDMGNLRYLPEVQVYCALMGELSNMIDSDDFSIKNEDGSYTFPALERMRSKYPWVEQIINTLNSDPDIISAFYVAFRKDFIPYWMQYLDGTEWKQKALNKELAEDSTMSDTFVTYNNGLKLTSHPIYDVTGNPIKESAEEAKRLLDSISSDMEYLEDSAIPNVLSNLQTVLRMLGMNINDSVLSSLIQTENGEQEISSVVNDALFIVNNILEGKIGEGTHIIEYFEDQYIDIARRLGSVSELSNVQSTREGDKTFYSYSSPNYINTMVKCMKNPERFESYIKEQFQKYDWFYNESLGGWLNGWLEELMTSAETRNQLSTREHKFFKNGDKIKEYRDWTTQDIFRVFIQEYFSIPRNRSTQKQYAMYNIPIFSDTEVAMFVKFSKFTGAHYKDDLVEAFRKVILQELSRINKVEQRRANGANEIMYFDKNGTKFQFFPSLNEPIQITSYDENGVETIEEINFLKEIRRYTDSNDIKGRDTFIRTVIRQEMEKQFVEFSNEVSESTKEDIKKYLETAGIARSTDDVNTFLEEYYWNNAYAQTQILELTITDPAFYKNGNDLQKRYKEVYAAGDKLNTNSKYGRKTEKTIYLADKIATSTSYYDIKQALDKAVTQGHIKSFDRDNILYMFRNVNGTDAQAYRSLDSYRAVLDMLGRWTPEMEEAVKAFENGNWTMKDFNIVWQTIKPFMFAYTSKDDGVGGTLKVGHQNKNSEFLLLSTYSLIAQSMGKSPKMKALDKFMSREGINIDVAQFISAVKTGGEGVVDITYSPKALDNIRQNHKEDWEVIMGAAKKSVGNSKFSKLSEFDRYKEGLDHLLHNDLIDQETYNSNLSAIEPSEDEVIEMLEDQVLDDNGHFREHVVHELPYDSYVVQQPTPEHLFDVRSIFGSQFRNLITSDMPSDFSLVIGGKSLNKNQVLRLYQGCITENLLEDYKTVSDSFANIETLQKELLSQVRGNFKYGRDILDALQIVETEDGQKVFNLPLDCPTIVDKIQELVLSTFKNRITKQYIKGGACIAVSNFGFTDELKIHYNEDGGIKYMDCYLPAYSKSLYEPFIGKDGMIDYSKMPDELKKIIGFRIPTEDKYSMFPLRVKGFLPQQNGSSIMLPMEVTTLSGMDFDVDKVFLMIPEFIIKDGKPRKIGYKLNEDNPELSAKDLSRKQRNNLIIDIAYGILTHPSTAEKILNPGNFNRLKIASRIAVITESKDMMNAFAEQFLEESTGNTSLVEYGTAETLDIGEQLRKKIAAKILRMSKEGKLEELDDFVSKHSKERNPLSPSTFAYYHQQNMVGAALIGMYANNTTAQAKFQQLSGFSIHRNFTFKINGRKIKSLSSQSTEVDNVEERISKMCSEWSAASVDNVKDPVLAKLMQNTKTANIAGTLIRAGLTIEEVGLLFRQPVIAGLISSEGSLNGLGARIDSILARIDEMGISSPINITKVRDGLITNDFLLDNIIRASYADSLTEEEVAELLVSQLAVAQLFKECIIPISEDISELTKISRADSPNGAIGTSLSQAKTQVSRVNRFLSRRENKDGKFALEGLSGFLDSELNVNMSVDQMRDAIFKSKMPMLQAFYSLGIELPTHLIKMKGLFSQASDSIDSIVNEVMEEANDFWLYGPKDNLKQVYSDITKYVLSKTRLFGDDENNTFWDKYSYYKYEYPKHFLEAVSSNPVVASLPIIRRLQVDKNRIVLKRSGRLDQSVREVLLNSMTSLLYMDETITMTENGKPVTYPVQKLAIDLFMYAFYDNGLNFGANTYSNFLSTQTLVSFPEFIQALRDMGTIMDNPREQQNFMDQLVANRGKKFLVSISDTKKLKIMSMPNGNIMVPELIALNKNNNKKPHRYVKYKGVIYRRNTITPSGVEYEPVKLSGKDYIIYNGNQTVAEIADTKIDTSIGNITPVTSESSEFDDILDAINYNSGELSNPVQDTGMMDTLNMAEADNGQIEMAESQLDKVPDFASYEASLDDRLSGITAFDEYPIDESNQQLNEPLCFN